MLRILSILRVLTYSLNMLS